MSHGTLVRAVLKRPLTHWYSDPLSCLHACLATTLLHAGADPLQVLGLRWEFLCQPTRILREEFYYPCRYEGDVARSIAPLFPVSSRWWSPADRSDPLSGLIAALRDNQPVIVAVDNFHLPFRPAYHDVHAAHLAVVWGVDTIRGEVSLLDSTPPAFSGAIAITDFLRAWGSVNPADPQDAFFSDSDIGYRSLLVNLTSTALPLGPAELAAAMYANLADLQADSADDPDRGTWAGMPGLRRYLSDLASRGGAGDAGVLADAYPFGWAMQAQAYLHAELLRQLGLSWHLPAVREAASAIASVAYAWTGVRMTAAHGLSEPAVLRALGRHCDRLAQRYEDAVRALGVVAGEVTA